LNGDEKDKKDECLIPYDAPSNYKDASNFKELIIDDEIDEWITLLRKRIGSEGHVLLLLESCHSGTAGRGNGKLNNLFVNENYESSSSKSDYFEPGKTKELGLGKYVLFSASQAYEINFHTEDDSGNEIGSLTYSLAKAFEQLPKGATYSKLFDMVKLIMGAKKVHQTPVNDGDMQARVFNGDYIANEPTLLLNTILEKGKEWLRIRGTEDSLATSQPSTGNTWAILVGISDYQNIKDLQFADRDAEVFYGYLNEVAKVPKENIFLFTNQRADRKNIFNALTNIDTLAQSGDKFIFFFAGHGDIEAENQPDDTALLLLHNSSDGNYLAEQDGYIKLTELRDAFNQFTDKNVSVQFYADACRSGAFNLLNNNSKPDTLKGGVKGRNRFLNGIQAEWLNQIKYVSCQVNENSLEGSEFSCGRGLFSLHLIDGLIGMADSDSDGVVTFAELTHYVNDKVRSQAKPRFQNPQKVTGDDNEGIAIVDSTALANYLLKQQQFFKTHQGDCTPFLSATHVKGDSVIIRNIDYNFREDYISFYKYLKSGKLVYPESDNAKKSFLQFREKLRNPRLLKVKAQFLNIIAGNMKADLIEGLQKGCMNIIKPLLEEIDVNNPPKYALFDTAHNYMSEVLNFLTKNHFLYKNYLARDLYLQSMLTIRNPNNEYNLKDENSIKADSLLKLSLELEPDMPYSFAALGDLNNNIFKPEKAVAYYEKGYRIMPNSPFFINALASFEQFYQNKYLKELEKFPLNFISNRNLFTYYLKFQPEKANFYFERALKANEIKYETKKTKYYSNLSFLYLTKGDLSTAKLYSDKCLLLDSTNSEGLLWQLMFYFASENNNLALNLVNKIKKYYPDNGAVSALYASAIAYENPKLALQEAQKSYKLNPNNVLALCAISLAYSKLDSLELALKTALKATKKFPVVDVSWLRLSSCYIDIGNIEMAISALLKADSLHPHTEYIQSNILESYRILTSSPESQKKYHNLLLKEPNNASYRLLSFISYYTNEQYKKADSLIKYLDFPNLNIPESLKFELFGQVKYRVKSYIESEKFYYLSISKLITKKKLNLVFPLLSRLKKFNEANLFADQLIKLQPNDITTNLNYGLNLTIQKKYDSAKKYFEKAEELDPKDNFVFFRWASFYATQSQEKEAYENMKKAFELGFKDLWRFEDEEFESIRDKNEFKELIKKYFPDKK
jgi:protein O-mannosyl-transferase